LKGCLIKFLKVKGAFIHGKWFCTEACGEQDPDTKEMKDLYLKGIDFENREDGDDDDEEVEIDL
jgi:hypothetical protein